ncbi:hypothetical protein Daesc_003550 [Daldinia eschscholtzii]|uniref:Uncharacterized protein n=1 Tax=Daldinia eschscholtzii TaxID=292717 RepID=A0AAX6MTS6_9PEZI
MEEENKKPVSPTRAEEKVKEKETVETTVDEKRAVPVHPKQPTPSEETAPSADATETAVHDAELSSPPESSSVSSVNPDMLGDEIVVGTRANGNKSPARQVASERGDIEMPDVEEDDEPIPHYPKRKRASLYNNLGDEELENSQVKDADDAEEASAKGKPRPKFDEDSKHVPVGYWRSSPVPQIEGKHMVVGFIDVRDRLRTRIRPKALNGDLINLRLFPIPSGPGGSWITFPGTVFLDHLIGRDHNVIKEYVKVRAETLHDRSKEADQAAITEALRRLELNPPPETPQPPSIAWGLEIPEQSQITRPEAKRRRYGSSVGTIAERADRIDQAEQADNAEPIERSERLPLLSHHSELPQSPRKPTRILVGCWAKSTAPRDEDKLAVYGILGANDMFRVKLVRETMDGRYTDDNFPSGAGALWISYDEVLFINHLKQLTRPEVKEYVRIRQAQIDAGEKKEDRVANETQAVHDAQIRAAAIAAASPIRAPNQGHGGSGPSSGLSREEAREIHEPRQPRREVASRSIESAQSLRHSHPEVEIRQASRNASNDPIERVQGYANREVARMEAVQLRTDRHQANRNTVANPGVLMSAHDNRRDFDENILKMNQVWEAQENMRMGPASRHGNGDVMMHQGIKYERKQNGPFKDRLVSQGTIINIDGEDYVEYRVLTKPSFF